jgi:hypothetical protein
MTLADFEQQVFAAAMASGLCGIPVLRRLTATSVNLRIDLAAGGFIDTFYNEQTGTTAYALIQKNRRVFGADNTGGWHVHPFRDPQLHVPLRLPMPFGDFVAEIERELS